MTGEVIHFSELGNPRDFSPPSDNHVHIEDVYRMTVQAIHGHMDLGAPSQVVVHPSILQALLRHARESLFDVRPDAETQEYRILGVPLKAGTPRHEELFVEGDRIVLAQVTWEDGVWLRTKNVTVPTD